MEKFSALPTLKMNGDGAFDEIEPLLAQLKLNAAIADDEVISEGTIIFNMEPDYDPLSIQVTYEVGNTTFNEKPLN